MHGSSEPATRAEPRPDTTSRRRALLGVFALVGLALGTAGCDDLALVVRYYDDADDVATAAPASPWDLGTAIVEVPGATGSGDDDDDLPPIACSVADEGPRPVPTDAAFIPGFTLGGVSEAGGRVADAHTSLDGRYLYVAGTFRHFGDAPASNVAVYHPEEGVDPLGDGVPYPALSVARDPRSSRDVWAVTEDPSSADHTLLFRWNGRRWSEEPVRVHGFVTKLRETSIGLVAVGEFLQVGQTYVEHAAVLGASGYFEPIVGGSPSARVNDVIDFPGGICIAGHFTTVGATWSPGMACQDQGGWNPAAGLPTGRGVGHALVEDDDGSVIVGGDFKIFETSTGEGSAIARWDRAGWHDVDGGLIDSTAERPGIVREIVRTRDGDLLVAGSFDRVYGRPEGATLDGLARYDGRRFSPVVNAGGSPVHVPRGAVTGLAPGIVPEDPDNPGLVERFSAFAYGDFTHAGVPTPASLVVWTGSRWSLPWTAGDVGRGIPGEIHDVAAPGACPPILVGRFFRIGRDELPHAAVLGSEGEAFGPLPGPGVALRRIAIGPRGEVAVAVAERGAQDAVWMRAEPEGDWAPLGGGVRGTVWDLAIGPDGTIYVGGALVSAGGAEAGNVVAWNGHTFLHMGGGPDGPVFDLAFDEGGRLLMAGDFDRVAGLATGAVARLRGARWEPAGVPTEGPVRAIGLHRGRLYAGRGDPSDPGRIVPGPLLEVLEPDGWRPQAEGLLPEGASVHAIASDGARLFVGGAFPTGLIALDGGAWRAPDGGVDGAVHAIAPTSLGLVIGGAFAAAGDVSSHGVALLAAP